ncbi:hypothetical protein GCM10023194_26450 [Planotetraspora phitsanulokensis]|uniref:Uncharacterized protein n=1 Tax=Planotetraspora phitsanulokensis TaxID=575192 RepID=A0A8J3XHH8_9ACTN|nr:hypothetical protein [Planotetraspora phitsanulokensis]GII41992.1 hypothetical protein Pph01_69950 [Planotetraspora phitsanulokensis]
MTVPMDIARRVADAVLYEGYLLYPYRASAAKNRLRWQFGVLVPPSYSATAEPSKSVTECLLETPGDDAVIHLRLRFLHLRSRTVEELTVDGGHRVVPELTSGETVYLGFDDATEREAEAVLPLRDLLAEEHSVDVQVAGDRSAEPILSPEGEPVGQMVMRQQPLDARLRVSATRLTGPYGLVRLHVETRNTSSWDEPSAPRDEALRRSLIAAHLLIGTTHGGFVSLIDPPEWARPAVDGSRNQHVWPVLVGDPGDPRLMLSSPIILYDYPDIAPESQGDMFDSTEIDEMLHLRAITLTEEETREAAATDPRVAEILRRAQDLPPELLERLHGVIRYLDAPSRPAAPGQDKQGGPVLAGFPGFADAARPPAGPGDRTAGGSTGDLGSGLLDATTAEPPDPATPPGRPWWDPGADASVSPETDTVTVSGVPLTKGSRVRLNPGKRRADAHDMFLAGRVAHVEAVFLDVDGSRHLAVTLADDPAADLQRAQGRFLYFAPDEVEPLGDEEAHP